MENNNLEPSYLSPDYSEDSPSEDDKYLEEMLDRHDLEDQRMEQLLDQQANLNTEIYRKDMDTFSNAPIPKFNSSLDNKSTSTNSSEPITPPWEKERIEREKLQKEQEQRSSVNGVTGKLWGPTPNLSGFKSPLDKEREEREKREEEAKKAQQQLPSGHREMVVCNLLDCLVEPYSANNKPGMKPSGMYDLKFKFNVWDRIKAFSPSAIGILVPHFLRNPVIIDYIKGCVSEYFMIPPGCVRTSTFNVRSAKIAATSDFVKLMKNKRDVLFIGTYCGEWGLSSEDLDVANLVGIECVSMFKLLGH